MLYVLFFILLGLDTFVLALWLAIKLRIWLLERGEL
jgi:hypothetical protein